MVGHVPNMQEFYGVSYKKALENATKSVPAVSPMVSVHSQRSFQPVPRMSFRFFGRVLHHIAFVMDSQSTPDNVPYKLPAGLGESLQCVRASVYLVDLPVPVHGKVKISTPPLRMGFMTKVRLCMGACILHRSYYIEMVCEVTRLCMC
jgi:hypothetical protein